MHFSNTFGGFLVATLSASFAAGSVIPAAAPGQGSFEVKRAPNPNFVGRNGPLALARALNKYGVAVPNNVKKAAEVRTKQLRKSSKRESGSATATPDHGDEEYTVPVTIGTPGSTLNLDFDTGSSDLWVFSTETSSTDGHSTYDPSSSSSGQKLDGATWNITYGDGSSSSGDVYTDVVKVGDLSVKSQAVESAKQVSTQFLQSSNDGLLGLGFSSINTVQPQQQKTWFDNISGSLDSALFVADLKHNSPGSYYFGSIPSEASNILYASVDNSQGFWSFPSSINGDSVTGIADTGTTLLLLDDSIVDSYYQQVDGAQNDSQQGGYVFDCSTSLPDFSFDVGDGTYTVPGDFINYASTGSGNQCFGGIQSSSGIGFSIFGDIALKAGYVIFDADNLQVGWAGK